MTTKQLTTNPKPCTVCGRTDWVTAISDHGTLICVPCCLPLTDVHPIVHPAPLPKENQ